MNYINLILNFEINFSVVPDPPPPSKPLPPIPVDGNRKAKAATPPRNNQNQIIPFQSSQQNRGSGVFKPPARRPEVSFNYVFRQLI